jgi:hypothetical protein
MLSSRSFQPTHLHTRWNNSIKVFDSSKFQNQKSKADVCSCYSFNSIALLQSGCNDFNQLILINFFAAHNYINYSNNYSRRRLIRSWIMLSISKWDQIYPDWQVPNYAFIPNVCLSSFAYWYQSVIVIKSDSITQRLL